jgi:hypothetical protein
MPRPTKTDGWSARLGRTIELRDDIKIATLSDARAFVLGLPLDVQTGRAWQRAAALLLEAAEDSDCIEAATTELEHALFIYGLWRPAESRWPRPGPNADRMTKKR